MIPVNINMNKRRKITLGQQLGDDRIDASYHLKDGRVFPIFSWHGSGGSIVHCNICDVVTVASTEEVVNHVISTTHRARLVDTPRATAALLSYVEAHGIREESASDLALNVDKEAIPPSSEDRLTRKPIEAQISLALNSNRDTLFIGLEFVVEVNPDHGNSAGQYFCTLCDTTYSLQSNIFDHLQSTNHRIRYLKKYFPRAYALFGNSDPNPDRWSPDVLRFLNAIVRRIVSVKGRLQVSVFKRSQWELKNGTLKSDIVDGVHLRETSDLVYSDIKPPCFAEVKSKLPSNHTGNPVETKKLVSPPSVKNKELPAEKELNSASKDATGRLCSTFSKKEGHGSKIGEVEAGTSLKEAKTTSLDKRTEEYLSKLSRLNQNVGQSEGSNIFDGSTMSLIKPYKQPAERIEVNNSDKKLRESQSWTDEEDEEIKIDKEVCRTNNSSSTSVKRKSRTNSPSNSHSRSISPWQKSRSHTKSRSRSRSPPRFHSGSRGGFRTHNERSRPYHQNRSFRGDRNYRGSNDRPPYKDLRQRDYVRGGGRGSGSESYQRQRSGRQSPNDDRSYKLSTEENRRLWTKLERELSVLEETLQRKRQFYEKRPEDHPLYAEEWKEFWQKRYVELKKEGQDPTKYDFKPDWILFWHKRMKEIDQQEIRTKKTELKAKYGLTDDSSRPIRSPKMERMEKSILSSMVSKSEQPDWKSVEKKSDNGRQPRIDSMDRKELVKNPSPPPQVVKMVVDAEVISSPEDFVKEESSTILIDSGNDELSSASSLPQRSSITSRESSVNRQEIKEPDHWSSSKSSSSALAQTSLKPDLLEVLRFLAALEECLGSLGPSVTSLLSRALSLERSKPGGSTVLQNESSCIDLLDTCKEKLKGLLISGMLEGVKAEAARSVVGKITKLLECCTIDQPPHSVLNSTSVLDNSNVGLPDSNNSGVLSAESPEMKRAQQIAHLLLKQGKSNISDRELQELLTNNVQGVEPRSKPAVHPPLPAPVSVPHQEVVAEPNEVRSAAEKCHSPVKAPSSGNTSSSGNCTVALTPPALPIDTALLIANLQAAGLLSIPKAPVDSVPSTRGPVNPPSVTAAVNSTPKTDNYGQFSPEELKTLVTNYKILTVSQQHDLLAYLRRLEEKNPVLPRPVPTSSNVRSSSPLSLKYRCFGDVVNPTAPEPSPSTPCRFPAIFKLTGLTSEDLEGFGLPCSEITVSATKPVGGSKTTPPLTKRGIPALIPASWSADSEKPTPASHTPFQQHQAASVTDSYLRSSESQRHQQRVPENRPQNPSSAQMSNTQGPPRSILKKSPAQAPKVSDVVPSHTAPIQHQLPNNKESPSVPMDVWPSRSTLDETCGSQRIVQHPTSQQHDYSSTNSWPSMNQNSQHLTAHRADISDREYSLDGQYPSRRSDLHPNYQLDAGWSAGQKQNHQSQQYSSSQNFSRQQSQYAPFSSNNTQAGGPQAGQFPMHQGWQQQQTYPHNMGNPFNSNPPRHVASIHNSLDPRQNRSERTNDPRNYQPQHGRDLSNSRGPVPIPTSPMQRPPQTQLPQQLASSTFQGNYYGTFGSKGPYP